MATTSIPPLAGLLPLSSSPSPKSRPPKHSSLPFAFPLSLSAPNNSIKATQFRNPSRSREKSSKLSRICATAGEILPPDSAVLETSKEIVSAAGDEMLSTIISALLFTAFVALTILTIGVVYIGVNDFLQKREKDKFEKEEAGKKSGKKKKVGARARAGPRGFGQKIDEFEDDD